MPDESKIVISALAESRAWQIGSVTSTRLSKTDCNFRSIRDFIKITEFTKMSGILKENKK